MALLLIDESVIDHHKRGWLVEFSLVGWLAAGSDWHQLHAAKRTNELGSESRRRGIERSLPESFEMNGL